MMGLLESIGRGTLAVADRIIPFTGVTYDEAFSDRLPTGNAPVVTTSRAMALPAAYACTVAISEDVAKVPFQMFELAGDERILARNHPLYDLIHDQPNDEQSAIEFREGMTAVALNRGTAIAEIVPGRRGRVDQLVPLHPDRIAWEDVPRSRARRLRYDDPLRGSRILMRDEVFILRGRFGVGVVTVMRQAFATMAAMQTYQGDMYERGLRSPGYLKHPGKLADKTRGDLRQALDEYQATGERAGRPMLLEEGMEWQTISLSMQDAEFLGSLADGYMQTCMAYRVPQHKIQQLMRSTNNNIEQQSVDYVTDSLVAWAVRWEQAVRRDLITSPRFMARHNLEGLLRGDVKTRFEAYAIACTIGWMTRAEVRQKEDMNPGDEDWDMDVPLVQLNMGQGGNVPGTSVALEGARHSVTQPSNAAVAMRLREFAEDGAARIVKIEASELRKVARKGDWESGVVAFYDGHAETVARVMRISAESAMAYCQDRAAALAIKGPSAVSDQVDDFEAISALTGLAQREADILQHAPIGVPA